MKKLKKLQSSRRILKEEIRENQILGGLLGFFNPSITQRLNGLVEKQEMAIKEQPLFPDDNNIQGG